MLPDALIVSASCGTDASRTMAPVYEGHNRQRLQALALTTLSKGSLAASDHLPLYNRNRKKRLRPRTDSHCATAACRQEGSGRGGGWRSQHSVEFFFFFLEAQSRSTKKKQHRLRRKVSFAFFPKSRGGEGRTHNFFVVGEGDDFTNAVPAVEETREGDIHCVWLCACVAFWFHVPREGVNPLLSVWQQWPETGVENTGCGVLCKWVAEEGCCVRGCGYHASCCYCCISVLKACLRLSSARDECGKTTGWDGNKETINRCRVGVSVCQ